MSARTPPIAVSLMMLPTEALEQILDEIFPVGERGTHINRDWKSLLATMKTCRTLYALGSVRLYYSPLNYRSSTFDKLARTLRNNGGIALCVQDLIRLSRTVESYQYGVPRDSSELQREQKWHEGLDLQLDVLKACTNVRDVSIVLYPENPIPDLLGRNRQLRYLALAFDCSPTVPLQERYGPKDLETFQVCLEEIARTAANSAERPRLSRLEIAPEGHSCPGSCSLGPVIRTLTAEVDLEISHMPELGTLRCCLDGVFGDDDSSGQPVRSPVELNIIDWSVDRDTEYSMAAFNELSIVLRGNRLVSFSYIENATAVSRQLHDYVDLAAPAVPPSAAFFALFPQVRHLCLADLHLMSLERLATLASTSPKLVTLKLLNALWNIEPGDLTLVTPEELSPFETRICEILETLEYLKEVDLGIWPYKEQPWPRSDEPGRIGLRAQLADRNIKLKVHGCR